MGWRQLWGALLFLLLLGGLSVLGRPVLEGGVPAEGGSGDPRTAASGAAAQGRLLWRVAAPQDAVWASPSGAYWAVAGAPAEGERVVTVRDRGGREVGAVSVAHDARLALADGPDPAARAWLLLVAEDATVRAEGPDGRAWSRKLPGLVLALSAPASGALAVATIDWTGEEDADAFGQAAVMLDARGREAGRILVAGGAVLAVQPAGTGRWLVARYGLVDGMPRGALGIQGPGAAAAWTWVTPNDGEVLYRAAASPDGAYVAAASRDHLYLFTGDGVRRWEVAPGGAPAAVAVTSRGHVVAVFRHPWWPGTSVVAAWDDVGRPLWRRQLGGEPVTLTLAGDPAAPQVWVVTRRHVLAFRSRNGEMVWSSPPGLGAIRDAVPAGGAVAEGVPGALALQTGDGWVLLGPGGEGP